MKLVASSTRNIDKMSSTMLMSSVSLLSLFVCLLSVADANYYYHSGGNTNTYQHSRNSGHYSAGLPPHHPIMHHKHHHGNNGRIQQAAVGVVSRGRLLPLPTTTVPTPTTTLSPLDRLMSRLDSLEKHPHNRYDDGRKRHDPYHQGRRHDSVPSSLLKSSDRRFAQMKSKMEDSYEDEDEEDEDDEDEDVLDDGIRDEEDEDDDEEENEEEYDRFGGMRHQVHRRGHSGQRASGHSGIDVSWYDGLLSDFPEHQSSGTGSGSGMASDGGSGRRGYTSYSDYKWQVLNKNNMDLLRSQKGRPTVLKTPDSSDIAKAVQHTLAINREGNCKIPRPRVIQVRDVYPHASKTYIPHCTILHQCTDDTGCCRDESLTCTASKIESVDLYFYTTMVTKAISGTRPKSNAVVEKLTFENHTECTCVDRQQEIMPRDRPFSGSEFDNLGRPDFRGYYRPDSESTKTVSNHTCRCTSHFSPRHADGSCFCECFDKQRDCLRLKRGKDFLTHEDRLCILRGDCMSPYCEFGSYLRKQGRCPRKREKFETWHQYPLHDEEYN